ncbi:MAG: SLC13 family permease [Gammaproteobacteria bacterium]|nr:SLC13 family permease [Gammaproteobacteria bacterium]MCW8840704.1 SLC13 family permease [Gammaproteobacteria bacterium]MCW8927742.1 SLC13 family permease [Gammaproteobacteria bacterium]MCW8959225.1 SLC13 family permease [Gammaproteobacteria bacterium]MCW8973789.1 SLC13 family permease [Gammaproteobacteria bacterium]
MIWVLGILAFTIYLFVSEIVRVDVAAVLVMVLLGLTTVIPDAMVPSLVDPRNLFVGFSSNAVISIIAVMIIGAGLDKTGLMSKFATFIMKVGGSTEGRIIPLISSTVGVISSFMQNVGAAALFIPVVSRISSRTGLPMSRLLMPMGFTAILGGTMTMIGSSPLILLNDLIITSNQSLSEAQQMRTFELFDVTPIGLALVATGIIYFMIAGRFVLPANDKAEGTGAGNTLKYFRDTYGLEGDIFELAVPAGNRLAGITVEELESNLEHTVSIIAMKAGSSTRVAPARDVVIEPGTTIALMGPSSPIKVFADTYDLEVSGHLSVLAEVLTQSRSGISEVVIPPSSSLVGKKLSEVRMRKSYGMNILVVYRGNEAITTDLRELKLQAGDTLVQHSTWEDLAAIAKNHNDFVVVTQDYPHEELRPQKVPHAAVFFIIALGLILFTDIRLSIALLTGAMGMILTRVLTIDEAYEAVSWKTVFLLASLIPLGAAVETTGTAEWIAKSTLDIIGDVSPFVLQAVIAVLATFFTLVMSNVGATVLLVPLAVNIAIAAQAQGIDANPAVFALTVAIATSNSFLIPTHQVNALIMGPAGYRVKDFIRAGSVMTVLFLIVMMAMLNVVF